MKSVFSRLPDSFFTPLASPNREHYAELLLIFYRLFLEYHTGVEREQVIAAFETYLITVGNLTEVDQKEKVGSETQPGDVQEKKSSPVEDGSLDLFGDSSESSNNRNSLSTRPEKAAIPPDVRSLANHFLRRLIAYGWMNEEEKLDFSRIINLSACAKPFFEALDAVSRGLEVEYESHIIAIYSSLCSDSAIENGEHAVLNAHQHTRLLVESLKVLYQNIREHLLEIFKPDAEIREILHIHYDLYMSEIVDKAYDRLKTSDNLFKYRPRIFAAVNRFLNDPVWCTRTAQKLAVIKRLSVHHTEEILRTMLREIRDELRNLDPLLESIDDKNRRYSRISTERIRARLYSDASLQGKIRTILKAWGKDDIPEELTHRVLSHNLFRKRFLEASSLYTRRFREVNAESIRRPVPDAFELEREEAELRLRIRNQLNPTRIAEFLDRFCPQPGTVTEAEHMIDGMESFVRLLYAAAYAEGRSEEFRYSVRWGEVEVLVGRFRFRRHSFTRRHPNG